MSVENQKAEPVKQEPVACVNGCDGVTGKCNLCPREELYAAPVSAKREWVDLTDDEIVMLYAESPMCDSEMIEFAREVITAFKEKNT